jgi:alpha-glucosidase (family GH31 glycosyl hydrolase)
MVTQTVWTRSIPIHDDEWWWGGATAEGTSMPWGRATSRPWRDLAREAGHIDDPSSGANQAAPMLVSSHGRFVVGPQPFAFRIAEGAIELRGEAEDPACEQAEEATLRGAYRAATAQQFPPTGESPARELFVAPQYNTWIEVPFTPSQDEVLAYARRVLDAGLPPGVLMIDDTWTDGYGHWRFDERRFPDPRAMVDQLHAAGFTVMLWVVPYIGPDSSTFRELERQEAGGARIFLRDAADEVVVRRWWNGFSAMLDLTSLDARDWWRTQLVDVQAVTGVDGFKFDGGDVRDLRPGDGGACYRRPVDQTGAYSRFGEHWPVNEFRASWAAGGRALAQRLHDKPPTWGSDGLASLIPEGIAQSLTGHAFICPDMVGGGDLAAFRPGADVDREQFLRYAQTAALFPMVQFSLNPARILADDELGMLRDVLALREQLMPRILALVAEAARTGEPILRPLAYHHPGFERVTDQFLLGEDVLVAPVLDPGATRREVHLPPGRWQSIGPGMATAVTEVTGTGTVQEIPVTLATLPVWLRVR